MSAGADYVQMQPHPDGGHHDDDDDVELEYNTKSPRKLNYKAIICFIIGYIGPIGIFYLALILHSLIITLFSLAILLLSVMIAIKYRDTGGVNQSKKSHALWIAFFILLIVCLSCLIHLYHEQDPYTFYISLIGYIIAFFLGIYGVWHLKKVEIIPKENMSQNDQSRFHSI